jgi:hypothetical protein
MHNDKPSIFIPTIYPTSRKAMFEKEGRFRGIPEATRFGVHVVVKVAPGGETYKIYLVDARNESMSVLGCLDCKA